MEKKIEVIEAAMWEKSTPSGEKYFSVRIDVLDGKPIWINLMKNESKTKVTQPDFKKITKKVDPAAA